MISYVYQREKSAEAEDLQRCSSEAETLGLLQWNKLCNSLWSLDKGFDSLGLETLLIKNEWALSFTMNRSIPPEISWHFGNMEEQNSFSSEILNLSVMSWGSKNFQQTCMPQSGCIWRIWSFRHQQERWTFDWCCRCIHRSLYIESRPQK